MLLLFILSLSISAFLTPLVRKIALRFKVIAVPNHRTVHNKNTPKLGGLAIFLAYSTGLLLSISLYRSAYGQLTTQYISILIASTLILVLGIVDDVKGLNCLGKFPVQFASALLVLLSGCKITAVSIPLGEILPLGIWSVPISLLWIVGITNAMNLLDGLDGLTTGVSLIITAVILLGSLQLGNTPLAISALVLAGAMLGFIPYNFNPAKIFLGDTGSLFIGFLLACFTIKGFLQPPGVVPTVVPLLILSLPIADTTLAILRRLRRRTSPFRADKEHIHHRLLDLGLGQRGSVLILYLVSLSLGILALLILITNNYSWLGSLSWPVYGG